MRDRPIPRRAALRAAGAIGLTALAGCATSPGDGADGDASPTGTDGPATTTDEPPAPIALRPVATGFTAPLDLAHAPDAGVRYVADQTGTVAAVGAGGAVEPFLDLTDRVVTGGERGLLGLALHPDYAENRRFFVRYSSPRLAGTPTSYSHTFVLSEFTADADGRRADPATERRLLRIPEPQGNHNAGSLAFGPDDLLYVGVGDGGAAGDGGAGHADGGNGQDVRDNLLGSILRIDVDGSERDRPYGIPDDNPLVGEVGLDEHYAWGLRNPWRLSFDGADCYVGDVGQNAWEEVDLVERGGNYGWNVREGTHCFRAETCPVDTPDGERFRAPIIEYPHGDAPVSGVSVIGGFVSRGDGLPELSGRYVFGDLNPRGRLFVADRPDGDGLWPTAPLPIAEADRSRLTQLLSFGTDTDDRLYALGRGSDGGGVYELVPGEAG